MADEKPADSEGYTPVLWDASEVAIWPVDPVTWLIKNLIAAGNLGFFAGSPKDGKSMLALDMCLSMVTGRKWLNRFPVCTTRPNIIYICREDPLNRLKSRLQDVLQSYGNSPPTPGRLKFLVRDRFVLTDQSWLDWLSESIKLHSASFVVLDVLNRMMPAMDNSSSKDMGMIIDKLEVLNRDMGVAMMCLDHTRKPPDLSVKRNDREPNPFDLIGSVSKYGAADFICMIARKSPTRINFYGESKDSDEHPNFYIDVSPKDSHNPKFVYAGDVSSTESNDRRVLYALSTNWVAPSEVYQILARYMKPDTVRRHFARLEKQKLVERRGGTNATEWRRKPDLEDETVFDDDGYELQAEVFDEE